MFLFHKELELAKEAALAAGRPIKKYFGLQNLIVSHKSPGQPLTEADLEANRVIRAMISQAFPSDGWLSEEDVDDLSRLQKERVWVVDPLDGTKDFIAKNPEFAVSIALVVAHEPVVGVIYNPITEELFTAGLGYGALLNGHKICVTPNTDLKKISLLVSVSENHKGKWERFKPFFESLTPRGGAAYKMALVALGRADASFTLGARNEWDICAGHLIVTEAGGLVSAVSGDQILYNQEDPKVPPIIFSNPHVCAGIIRIIEGTSIAAASDHLKKSI